MLAKSFTNTFGRAFNWSHALSLIFLLSVVSGFSQSPAWRNAPTPNTDPQIKPAKFRTVSVDFEALKSHLLGAPNVTNTPIQESTYTIDIPHPDGESWTFIIAESSIMHPNLQAEYPNMRTYIGQGTGDYRHATARFDFTPKGFHGQIIIPGGTFYIDPYSPSVTDTYIAYTRKDFYATNTKTLPSCEPQTHSVTEELGSGLELGHPKNSVGGDFIPSSQDILPLASNGTQLRTYDLALACTGEYASFHGGNVTDVMAAYTTSMNRVNGVFERDLSLQMIMVDDTDELIFLNSSTDPYSNGNGSAMLGQNQETCDDIIGSSNYDIGHVFSTGGGGVAYLGATCNNNIKAGGVTGQSSPVGDPFDIDYVAHEMGHQWGANHTQNNSCNRTSSSAYEPGSASTIMGYAGICSPNLQSNSDDHFHNRSYNQMYSFSVTGSGDNCATTSSTGNTPPTVSVIAGGFFIPVETPFELTATASDVNGDELTYCWEQYDLGPATSSGDNDLTDPSGNAPIFRSWSPTLDDTRVFPRLFNLVNNSTVIGEHLPTYSRDLTFRCTVRDNRAGGGGVSDAEVEFEATDNAGPFLVTSPNTSTTWNGNSIQMVTWDVANTDQAPVNCSTVDIFLSVDGGYTYPFTLATDVPNSGSAGITVPNLSTTAGRVKVKAHDNIFFDISNQNITIEPGVVYELDAGLGNLVSPEGDVCGTEVAASFEVMNLGSETITSLSIFYEFVGGPSGFETWTGSIDSGEIEVIDLGNFTLSSGSQTLNILLLSPNGQTDENPSNDANSFGFDVTELEGEELPITNNFSGSFPGTGWSVENPDGSTTWVQETETQSNCTNGSVAKINFYNYNSPGETDDIVSPLVDLLNANAPELSFDYAYARYSSSFFDRMQVQIQSGCDPGWITLWDQSNLQLATAGSVTSDYAPSCSDWETVNIDLSDYTGDIVQIRFRGITGWGNNLYLDNINIEDDVILDCEGTPNGSAYVDACGVCDDNPANDNETCADCEGTPNGSAYVDECGVCDDNPANDNQTCADCEGTPNGSAYVDECGVCDDNPANDNETCADCEGTPNGSAYVDECGICDDNPANDNETCADCEGTPNGSAYVDACGVCDDNPANDNETCADCEGTPNGSAYVDACGVCDDNPANDNETCADCEGTPNGSAYVDACGVCDDNPANDNETCTDCQGTPNGSAYVDDCGVCDDNPANDNETCADCEGTPNGSAYVDECGVCDDNPANDNVTCADCEGTPNGSAYVDECGVCDDNPANDNETCADCEGTPNGSAYVDACGVCDDNPANDNETCADCEGTPNGSAYVDECGVCDDNPANDNETCADCEGTPNGSAYVDECGVCDDNPANDNETCADCEGTPNGSAYVDDCGTCVGGDTGMDPCVIGCTSPTACNYDPLATVDDDSCIEPVPNCTECNESNDGLDLIDSDGDGICDADETTISINTSGLAVCGEREVHVFVHDPVSGALISTLSTTLDEGETLIDTDLAPGEYDIFVRVDGYLSIGFESTTLDAGSNGLELSGLVRGDINLDDSINIVDISILNAAFNSQQGDLNYNPLADLDCSGSINIVDVSIVNPGFGLVGAYSTYLNN